MAHALRNLREPDALANDFGYDEELACWLAESGRRRVALTGYAHVDPVAAATSAPVELPIRRLVLLGVFALRALQARDRHPALSGSEPEH